MAEEEKAAAEKGSEKKNKAILFVVIGIVVVLLILVGIVVAMMMSGGDEEAHAAPAPQAQEQATPSQQAAKIIVGNTVSVRSTDKFSPGLIYPVEGPIDITVNLMTQTGKRYLKTSMQFELDKDEAKANATKAELDKKLPMLKDTIIEILSSKSIEDVATAKGKNRVKDEIVKRINEFLVDGKVSDVFFVAFVVS